MTLAHLFRFTRLLRDAEEVMRLQDEKIALLERDLRVAHLEYNREMRALVCSWLVSLEMPETDMRADLARLDSALGNRVAQLEEHVL